MVESTRTMFATHSQAGRVASGTLGLGLIWLLIAISSIVQHEPAPYDVLALALIAGFFAVGLRVPARLGSPIGLLTLYLLGNLIAALISPDPMATVGTAGTRIYLVLTWLLLACVISEDPKRMFAVIWNAYLTAAILAALVGILGYFAIISVGGDEGGIRWGRATGPFKDANVLGPFLVPAIIYLVARLESLSGFKALPVLAMFTVLVLANFLTFSRGAWAVLAMAFVIYLCMRLATSRSAAQTRRSLIVGAVLVGFTGVFLMWMIATGEIGEFFYQRAALVQDYDVGHGGRFDVQSEVLAASLTNPLGIGPGRAILVFDRVPHSLYLNALIEAGWLGAIGMWGFALLSLWRGFLFCLQPSPVQQIYLVVFASLAATLAESLVIGSTHWRHLYLLFAMTWAPIAAYPRVRRPVMSFTQTQLGRSAEAAPFSRQPER